MRTIAPLLLLSASAFGAFGSDDARQKDEDNIREAVFRYQFDKNTLRNMKVYFIMVGGGKNGDPSDEFVKRFADHKPPVRKGSATNADRKNGVVDKKTGEVGLIFYVGEFKWISDAEVEVKGGHYASGIAGSGNTYTVKREDGKWKVMKDKTDFKS